MGVLAHKKEKRTLFRHRISPAARQQHTGLIKKRRSSSRPQIVPRGTIQPHAPRALRISSPKRATPKTQKNFVKKRIIAPDAIKNALSKNRAAHSGAKKRNTPCIDRGAKNDDRNDPFPNAPAHRRSVPRSRPYAHW
jgi:hypothetical protein